MADLASAYLSGVQSGEGLVQKAVDSYDKARSWQQKLQERERALAQEAPLTPDQQSALEAGKIPTGLTRTQQLTVGKTESEIRGRELIAAAKATALAQKDLVTPTDADKRNYKIAYGSDMPTDMNQMHAAQRQQIADLAKQKEKPDPKAATALKDSDNQKIITDYAAKNNMSMDALRPGGMGGWNSANLAIAAQMIKDHPDYDTGKLKTEFAGQLSGAKTTASKAADIRVNLDSAHSAFTTVMDQAAKIADRMGQKKLALYNQAVQSGKMQFNDPDTIAFNALMDEGAGNYGRITKGGSASIDQEGKRDALKVLSNRLDSGGIKAVKEAVETEYNGRIKGLPGGSKSSGSGSTPASHDPLGLGI